MDGDIDLFVREKRTGTERPLRIHYINFYHPTDTLGGSGQCTWQWILGGLLVVSLYWGYMLVHHSMWYILVHQSLVRHITSELRQSAITMKLAGSSFTMRVLACLYFTRHWGRAYLEFHDSCSEGGPLRKSHHHYFISFGLFFPSFDSVSLLSWCLMLLQVYVLVEQCPWTQVAVAPHIKSFHHCLQLLMKDHPN